MCILSSLHESSCTPGHWRAQLHFSIPTNQAGHVVNQLDWHFSSPDCLFPLMLLHWVHGASHMPYGQATTARLIFTRIGPATSFFQYPSHQKQVFTPQGFTTAHNGVMKGTQILRWGKNINLACALKHRWGALAPARESASWPQESVSGIKHPRPRPRNPTCPNIFAAFA